jgi:hypothetical protein
MHPSILFASNSIKLHKTGQFQNVVDFYFIRPYSQESLSCRAWVTFLLSSIYYFYKIICQLAWISFRISFISVVEYKCFTIKITFHIQNQFWWNKKRIKITQPCFYLILASYKIRNRFFDSSDTFWYYISLLKYLYWRFILDINTLVDILH